MHVFSGISRPRASLVAVTLGRHAHHLRATIRIHGRDKLILQVLFAHFPHIRPVNRMINSAQIRTKSAQKQAKSVCFRASSQEANRIIRSGEARPSQGHTARADSSTGGRPVRRSPALRRPRLSSRRIRSPDCGRCLCLQEFDTTPPARRLRRRPSIHPLEASRPGSPQKLFRSRPRPQSVLIKAFCEGKKYFSFSASSSAVRTREAA